MKGLRLDDLKNEVTFATELIESIKSGPEPEKWKDTLAGFRRDRKKFKREIVRRIQEARKVA